MLLYNKYPLLIPYEPISTNIRGTCFAFISDGFSAHARVNANCIHKINISPWNIPCLICKWGKNGAPHYCSLHCTRRRTADSHGDYEWPGFSLQWNCKKRGQIGEWEYRCTTVRRYCFSATAPVINANRPAFVTRGSHFFCPGNGLAPAFFIIALYVTLDKGLLFAVKRRNLNLKLMT